jgi:citrate lyase beta subunit
VADVRRSVLFTPGDNEARMAKALGLGADTVCFDLEDAVAPANKEAARHAVVRALQASPRVSGAGRAAGASASNPLDGPERCVRINALQGDEWRRDVQVVMDAHPDAIMIPKAEDETAIARLSAELGEEESRVGMRPGQTKFLLIFETARGVLRSLDVASAAGQRLAGVLFGAEDLAADAGILRTRESAEVLMARSHVALAAAACRVPACDQVFVDIKDAAGLETEARQARVLGYSGKMAIHPDQLAPIHRAFTPSPQEVERALRLLQAAQAAGGGVFAYEGRMIDQPLLTQAERVVRTAQRAGLVR